MNLSISEEQILIRESAKKFLELNYSFEKRREIIEANHPYYFKHWKSFAELGWLGLYFPEEVGGFGENISNLMTLMESLGSNLTLENISLYLISQNKDGYEIRNYETIDNMKSSNIDFNSLELNKEELILKINKEEFFEKFDYIFDLATLSICSEALGIIDKMYDLTLEYCKTRKQFGKAICSFQVIQHRLVDMHIIKEEMRSLNYMAQLTLNEKKEIRKKNISLNKIFLGSRAKSKSQECIQFHGGMGVAKEMSIGLYFS